MVLKEKNYHILRIKDPNGIPRRFKVYDGYKKQCFRCKDFEIQIERIQKDDDVFVDTITWYKRKENKNE